MYIDKVRVHYKYNKIGNYPFYIVYSQCGSYRRTFTNIKEAVEFASEEYDIRVQRQELQDNLDKI